MAKQNPTPSSSKQLQEALRAINRARGLVDVLSTCVAHDDGVFLEEVRPDSLYVQLSAVDEMLVESERLVQEVVTAAVSG